MQKIQMAENTKGRKDIRQEGQKAKQIKSKKNKLPLRHNFKRPSP